MGRKKVGRDISGVLLLDKPTNITSNQILQTIKKLFFAKKAGHTGSLDPLATGLLPICFGEATKFSNYLLNADKTYQVICQLGITTDSGDSDGSIIATSPVNPLSNQIINTKLKELRSREQQIPPMHSAIKINGEALYKKAHCGQTVKREPRDIKIYSFDLIENNVDQLILSVHCSKGTYIRTLVEDLGKELGTGAHVIALRRTSVGNFQSDEMVNMKTLQDCYHENDHFVSLNNLLLPVEAMVQDIPCIHLTSEQKYYIMQGQAMRINNIPKAELVSLFFEKKFIGVGVLLEDGRIKPKRLVKNIN